MVGMVFPPHKTYTSAHEAGVNPISDHSHHTRGQRRRYGGRARWERCFPSIRQCPRMLYRTVASNMARVGRPAWMWNMTDPSALIKAVLAAGGELLLTDSGRIRFRGPDTQKGM